MRNSEQFQSQRDSFGKVSNSRLNLYRETQDQNENMLQRRRTEQKSKVIDKDRLDKIIAKTFEDLNNDKIEQSIQESSYENQRRASGFDSGYIRNDDNFQFARNIFNSNEDYAFSIVNSSNKSSFERRKQSNSSRVPGKLTNSDESMGAYGVRKSEDQDHYYKFTLKKSTLNSKSFFNLPSYDSQIEVVDSSSALNKNQQEFSSDTHLLRQNPNSNKSGFIKQNRLNSRFNIKNQQSSNQMPISEREEFQIQFNYQKKQRNQQNQIIPQYEQDRNKILDDEFWRKIDQQKSPTQSLKHTFDTSKTNGYPISSQSHNQFQIRAKNQTNYSEYEDDRKFEDSICSSARNQFNKQYEADLFDFIKKELINTTLENRRTTEKELKVVTQFNAEKDKNLKLYHLYRKTKYQFRDLINEQKHSIKTFENDIKLLEEQINFFKQHSNCIEKEIAVKMKKQEEFYFKHKTNLQEIILSNNHKISELKNQLFDLQNQSNPTSCKSKQSKIYVSTDKSSSLSASLRENQRLKLQLKEQKILYDKTLKKLTDNNQVIHELQSKKAEEIKSLVQQFQSVKRYFFSQN